MDDNRVWVDKYLRENIEINVYKAVVLTTFFYGLMLWVTYCSYLQILKWIHQLFLRTILGIHWSAFIGNVGVLEQEETISVEVMLLKTQLLCTGPVSMLDDHCTYCEPSTLWAL